MEDKITPQGHLKIFLGMSAGVGKTYTMLREAQNLARRGVSVKIAWLEPHGRAETDAQAENLERIAPISIEYRGIVVSEMDLETVLAARPQLVLVDELAHSNTPGMRHPKRWQDIYDLLDAGIDVHTTVNIQHLESVADMVEDMSRVSIRERVPDAVFDRADNIQVVDISPSDLQSRLMDGKVYTGDATQQAVSNFFRAENLTALRELALSQAAKTAGHQLNNLLQGDQSPRTSANGQTILVAVSPSPNSEYLLRWTRRLAFSLNAEWTCIYIETGAPMTDADKDRLVKHLTLGRNLGARVVSMINDDIVKAILGYAQHNRFQTLVVGKSGISRPRLFRTRHSVTDRLIRESGQMSVIAVQERANPQTMPVRLTRKLDSSLAWQFGLALLTVAITTLINLVITLRIGYLAASIVYLAAISLLGLIVDRRAVITAALVSAILWNFLFIPPRFTFLINKTEDLFMLFLYFVLAITSGWASSKLKANSRILELREQRMEFLSDLAHALATVSGIEEVVGRGLAYINQAFKTESFMVLRDETGNLVTLKIRGFPALLDEKDTAAMGFCFSNGHATGRFTSTLPAIKYHFLPLAAAGGTIGIIGLRFENQAALTDDQHSFLQTLSRTLSIAVERELLAAENRRNLLLQESERLSTLLVHSISHELRTPLTVIKGSASALTDNSTGGDPSVRQQLLDSILVGTDQLNDIIENLLSINRLESGLIQLKLQAIEPTELVDTAIAQCQKALAGRPIFRSDSPHCPLVQCDEVLILQVIRNILLNAARYTPANSALDILTQPVPEENLVRFIITDQGSGVPDPELNQIFDKFWRGPNAGNGGTGLGLAICKGIVEIHGGNITAENQAGKGLSIAFTLPTAAKLP